MTEDDRGKRRLAIRVAVAWGLFSLACLAGVVFGQLGQFELDALVGLHSAVTMTSGVLIFGLLGLDATAAQIIPAWRGQR